MLGWFASDFFAQSPLLAFPLVGLTIFITVFGVITLRTIHMGKGHAGKARIQHLASLPLNDSNEEIQHD